MDIIDAIADALVTALTSGCITVVATGDRTRCKKVTKGRLQDDPETYSPYISVSHDPEKGSENIEETVGGATMWRHHFLIKGVLYMTRTGESKGTAWDYAGTLRNRMFDVLYANRSLSVVLADGEYDIGNLKIDSFVTGEKGGPPREWIWEVEYRVWIESDRPVT